MPLGAVAAEVVAAGSWSKCWIQILQNRLRSGWWYTYPSEKSESQLGLWNIMKLPTEWKNKINVPNHQSAIHLGMGNPWTSLNQIWPAVESSGRRTIASCGLPMSSAILLACEALVPGVLSCWQISRRKDIPKSLHDRVGPDHEQETAHFPCQTNMAWHVPGFLLPHISSGSGTCPFLGQPLPWGPFFPFKSMAGWLSQGAIKVKKDHFNSTIDGWKIPPIWLRGHCLVRQSSQRWSKKKTVLGMNWIMNLNIGKWRFTLW